CHRTRRHDTAWEYGRHPQSGAREGHGATVDGAAREGGGSLEEGAVDPVHLAGFPLREGDRNRQELAGDGHGATVDGAARERGGGGEDAADKVHRAEGNLTTREGGSDGEEVSGDRLGVAAGGDPLHPQIVYFGLAENP